VENDLADEVKGKLRVAGASLRRVIIPLCDAEGVPTGRLAFPGDLSLLTHYIQRYRAAAVFLEPVDSFLAEAFDVNSMAHVRGLLDGLSLVGRTTGAAVVFTRHLRKDRTGEALAWVNGSAAWGHCPASVLMMQEHPDGGGTRMLSVVKARLAKDPPT
jgi:hypothetical protein